ncbi:hypothetical protein ACQEVZ_07765 [Dactylosporangium sp. CA-152071]|uniref:hypothetical protein n=1 Tax=Dactylosporangium sp. CA-152071 TaxID=3239933 RepID=UPI003D8FC661
MAGLSIVVCLPPDSVADVVAALDSVMAPFEAMRGFAPERDQWERWSIRGGSDGFGFRVLPGMEHDPRLIHDEPHWQHGPQPSLAGMCAGGPRGLLDLAGPVADAEIAAGRLWDLFHQLRGEMPTVLPLEHFRTLPENQVRYMPVGGNPEQYPLQPNHNLTQALQQYRAQPLIQQLRAAPCFSAGVVRELPDMLPWFALPREEYVAQRAEDALRQSELLTLDGWWIERNYLPVHGACESLDTCPHRADRSEPWTRAEMAAYLEHLAEDVIIVQLHCKV